MGSLASVTLGIVLGLAFAAVLVEITTRKLPRPPRKKSSDKELKLKTRTIRKPKEKL